MEFTKESDTYVVRLARGEEIMASITQLVKDEDISGGFIFGLGAAKDVQLAHYSVADKKYSSKSFEQPLEITNITGSIAWLNSEPVVHCHVTCSDTQMNCYGGHLVEAVVTGTLELMLLITTKLEKKVDDQTGLKVLNLNE